MGHVRKLLPNLTESPLIMFKKMIYSTVLASYYCKQARMPQTIHYSAWGSRFASTDLCV